MIRDVDVAFYISQGFLGIDCVNPAGLVTAAVAGCVAQLALVGSRTLEAAIDDLPDTTKRGGRDRTATRRLLGSLAGVASLLQLLRMTGAWVPDKTSL